MIRLYLQQMFKCQKQRKINNAVGGVTLEALGKENDTAVINKTADRAIKYLSKAIEIHQVTLELICFEAMPIFTKAIFKSHRAI